MTGASAFGSADFLILLVAGWVGPEVGDRGRHHQHMRVGRVLGDGVFELSGGADVDDLDTGRIDQARRVACDERDVGAALGHHAGHRVALLARAAVPDESHRVDGLAGSARTSPAP